MDKKELILYWRDNHRRNGFLLGKHDPYKLGHLIHPHDRSVVCYELGEHGALDNFLKDGQYQIQEYYNRRHGTFNWAIQPYPNSIELSGTAASGVAAGSLFATTTYDNLFVADGRNQGPHIFGETTSGLERQVRALVLGYLRTLR